MFYFFLHGKVFVVPIKEHFHPLLWGDSLWMAPFHTNSKGRVTFSGEGYLAGGSGWVLLCDIEVDTHGGLALCQALCPAHLWGPPHCIFPATLQEGLLSPTVYRWGNWGSGRSLSYSRPGGWWMVEHEYEPSLAWLQGHGPKWFIMSRKYVIWYFYYRTSDPEKCMIWARCGHSLHNLVFILLRGVSCVSV